MRELRLREDKSFAQVHTAASVADIEFIPRTVSLEAIFFLTSLPGHPDIVLSTLVSWIDEI